MLLPINNRLYLIHILYIINNKILKYIKHTNIRISTKIKMGLFYIKD